MPLFHWKRSYEIGVNEIDMQHRQLVGMINELFEAMKEGQGPTVVDEILDQLVDYVQLHFSTEERYMQTHYYPDLEEHERQHLDMTRHVVELIASHRAGKGVKTPDLMNFLRDWLVDHISVEDKKFGAFLKKRWTPLTS